MTPKERAAMQQALEALESCAITFTESDEIDEAITALREALAEQVHTPYCKQAPMCKTPCGNSDCVEQAEQEPVAYAPIITFLDAQHYSVSKQKKPEYCNPLYAHPVRTKDLTDDEIHQAFYSKNTGLINGIRAVIAADRAKNNLCDSTYVEEKNK